MSDVTAIDVFAPPPEPIVVDVITGIGPAGPPGPQGPQGEVGPEGPQGEPGDSFPDAPEDSLTYGRRNLDWSRVVAVTGDTMTGRLEISAPAPALFFRYSGSGGGAAAFQSFSNTASLRWTMSFSTSSETGANAGSDFTLNAYSDAGAFLGTPITVARGTLVISLGGVVQFNYGSAAAPALTFPFETTTGIYRSAANTIGFSASGVLRLSISATALTPTVPIRGQNGTVGAPAYSFSGDTNTGIYSIGADTLGLGTNGTLRLTVGTTTIATTLPLDMTADSMRLRTAKTPASAVAAGNAGDICWDSGFVYVCVAANTWKRAALATW